MTRQWKAGDVVRVTLPAALRLEKAKDDPAMASFFFGPVLLAGELGRENMPNDVADKDAHLRVAAAAVPDVASSLLNPAEWLRPVQDEALAFTLNDAGPGEGMMFRPLYKVHHQRYSVYWRMGAEGGKANP